MRADSFLHPTLKHRWLLLLATPLSLVLPDAILVAQEPLPRPSFDQFVQEANPADSELAPTDADSFQRDETRREFTTSQTTLKLPTSVDTASPASRGTERRTVTVRQARPVTDPVNRNERFRDYVVGETHTENTLTLYVNRPRILKLKQAPVRTYIPEAGSEVIAIRYLDPDSARQIAIEPLGLGTTVLTLWFEPDDGSTDENAVSFLIHVLDDPEEGRRFEEVLSSLEQEINRTFPNSVVRLSYIGSQVVVRGQAKDIEEGTQILRIVSASLPGDDEKQLTANDLQEVTFLNAPGMTEEATETAGTLFGALNGDQASGVNQGRINNRIVNLLEIAGIHQVMLKVTVAEVNRSATRAVGANLEIGNAGNVARFFTALGTPDAGGSLVINRGDFDLAIRALKELNLARSLAEPTLTTLNGRQASFNVGGSFPVPVVTGATATGLQGVEFRDFGVQLNFVPIVTDHDRVRLNMMASVTTRDDEAATDFGTASVPGMNARRFQNTVELREGQTLAVAGLIQNNLGGRSRRIPFAGDLPFIGRAFANDGTSYDEQELIVLVTPYLVNPLEPEVASSLALPGSDYFEPDDVEFFLRGSLTGHIAEDYRTPVRTDIQKMKAFRRCEQQLIIGQPGHSNGLLCPPAFSTSRPGVQP
jgi:pilus assembly protein CpaC